MHIAYDYIPLLVDIDFDRPAIVRTTKTWHREPSAIQHSSNQEAPFVLSWNTEHSPLYLGILDPVFFVDFGIS